MKKAGLLLSTVLTVFLAASCSHPVNGEEGEKGCGKCPEGTECNVATNKCETLCNEDDDCGSCSKCEQNFCNKYADFCVVKVEPESNATNVPISRQTMKITFSGEVNPNSVTSANIGLLRNDNEPITSTPKASGKEVELSIGTILSPATKYTIWVAKELQSKDFIFLNERFESSFNTVRSDSTAAGPAGFGLSPVAGQMKGGKYTLDVVGGPIAGTAEKGGSQVTVSDGFWK